MRLTRRRLRPAAPAALLAPGSGPPPQVAILALTEAARAEAAAVLQALGAAAVDQAPPGDPVATLYAVHAAPELIGLMGPECEPRPHSLVLDLAGSLDPEVAAWLGFLGWARVDCRPEGLLLGLQQIRAGLPFAQQELAGRFHHTREQGRLTVEEKQILRLEARSCTREQIGQALGIEPGTLRHRVTALRRRLGLRRGELLPVAAVRLGFPTEERPRG